MIKNANDVSNAEEKSASASPHTTSVQAKERRKYKKNVEAVSPAPRQTFMAAKLKLRNMFEPVRVKAWCIASFFAALVVVLLTIPRVD
jgi:hypothetical protein